VLVDFDNFAREPRRFNGQCVRGVGIHNGLGLYGNSTLLRAPSLGGPRAILLEISDVTGTGDQFTRVREHGEFTGLAYFCQDLDRYRIEEFEANKSAINARLRAMGAEEIFAITDGSCIYSESGAVLILSEWRPTAEMPAQSRRQ